jgi:TM2 domain-containing membrane protein YozV
MSNIVRLIIACVIMGAAVTMAGFGMWGWGILVLFLGGVVLLSFFFNENMIIAQFYLRKENSDKSRAMAFKDNRLRKTDTQRPMGLLQPADGIN